MKPKVNRRKEVTKKRVSMKWKMKNNRETMMKPQGRALQSFLQPEWLGVREVVSYWYQERKGDITTDHTDGEWITRKNGGLASFPGALTCTDGRTQ